VLVATSTALLRTLRGPLQAVPAIACRVMQPCSQHGRRWRRRGNIAAETHSADTQCRTKAGAIDDAAQRPFRKYTHGHGREKELLLYMVDTISGKSLKLLPPDVIF